MSPTAWVDKKTGRPLPQTHDITCSDTDCAGCYGDGRWQYVPDEVPEALDEQEQALRDAIERFIGHTRDRIRSTQSKKLDDYQDLIDGLTVYFLTYMERLAMDQHARWKAKGIKAKKRPEENAKTCMGIAKRAARAILSAKIHDAGLITAMVLTFVRWVA